MPLSLPKPPRRRQNVDKTHAARERKAQRVQELEARMKLPTGTLKVPNDSLTRRQRTLLTALAEGEGYEQIGESHGATKRELLTLLMRADAMAYYERHVLLLQAGRKARALRRLESLMQGARSELVQLHSAIALKAHGEEASHAARGQAIVVNIDVSGRVHPEGVSPVHPEGVSPTIDATYTGADAASEDPPGGG